MTLGWIQAGDRLVGKNGLYTDTLNRALREVLIASGYNPDVPTFPGLDGPVYNVVAFGADITGGNDSTTAIAAAIAAAVANGGGRVVLPAGTIKGHIDVPTATSNRVRITGAGKGATVLVAAQPNRPVVRHQPTAAGASDGFYLGGFTVKPHASNGVGSGAALDLAGFRMSTFEDIDYVANGGGYFESMFTLSAIRTGYTASPCYFNTIIRPSIVAAGGGIKYMIRFENDGTAAAANNANGTTIINPQAYANSGMLTLIDALRSASTTIIDPWFESNTGAIALIPGTITRVYGGWWESNILDGEITFQVAADGTSNGGLFQGLYMSSPGTLTIAAGTHDNVFESCGMPNKTVVDNGTNTVVRSGNTTLGYAADLSRTVKNTLAGGTQWREIYGATGGTYGAGTRALVDDTNAKLRDIIAAAGRRVLYGGASGIAALRLVPFDNVSGTAPVLEGLDSTEAVTAWQILQNGTLNLAGGGAVLQKGGVQILGARNTGWTAMTGTATKGGFDTATVTVAQLAQVVKAMLDSSMTHGYRGA